jgi:hypothetical protein
MNTLLIILSIIALLVGLVLVFLRYGPNIFFEPKSIIGYVFIAIGFVGILYFGFYLHFVEAAKGLLPH